MSYEYQLAALGACLGVWLFWIAYRIQQAHFKSKKKPLKGKYAPAYRTIEPKPTRREK